MTASAQQSQVDAALLPAKIHALYRVSGPASSRKVTLVVASCEAKTVEDAARKEEKNNPDGESIMILTYGR